MKTATLFKPRSSTTTYELLDTMAYHNRLIQEIGRAKHRVTLVTLLLLSGPLLDPILKALEEAAERGVKIKIVLDTFTWYYSGRGWLPFSPFRATDAKGAAITREVLKRLRRHRSEIIEIGRIGLNPYRGRSHTKITIIDDDVYSFGGINLHDEGFEAIDYMLAMHHSDLADEFDLLAVTLGRGKPKPDRTLSLDPYSSVLIDGGRPAKSIIYDRACELAEQATRVHYVSQFCPTGRLANLLKGPSATCYFNPRLHSPAHIGMMVAFDMFKTGIRNHYNGKTFLHAKYILYELDDGSRALITGSHNFSRHGVSFGTKEIALYSTNNKLWDQLYSHLETEVKGQKKRKLFSWH